MGRGASYRERSLRSWRRALRSSGRYAPFASTDCGRALGVTSGRAAGYKHDDTRMLLHNVSGRRPRGNELRFHQRGQGHHEFVNGQLQRVLRIAIVLRSRAVALKTMSTLPASPAMPSM